MILVVYLLEVAILTATNLFLLLGSIHFCQIPLVTNKESVSSQVLISIVCIRLDALRGMLFAQKFHLCHLVFIQALSVAVVRIRIGKGLDWSIFKCTRGAWPCIHLSWIGCLLAIEVIVRLDRPITEHFNEFVKFALNKEL